MTSQTLPKLASLVLTIFVVSQVSAGAATLPGETTTQPTGTSLTDFQSKTSSSQSLIDSKNSTMTLATASTASSTTDPAPSPYQNSDWTVPSDLRQVDTRDSQGLLTKRSYFKTDNTLYSAT